MAIICFSPPDREKMSRSISGAMPKRSATWSMRSRMASGWTPVFSRGKASSLRTSVVKNWVLGFWKTDPTCSESR